MRHFKKIAKIRNNEFHKRLISSYVDRYYEKHCKNMETVA